MSSTEVDSRPTGRRLIGDLAVGGLVALITTVLVSSSGPALMITGTLLGLAIALRRVSLSAMSGLALAAAVLQVSTGGIHYLADAAYAWLFYTLGRQHHRGWRRFGLASAVVAAVVAGIFMAFQEGSQSREISREVFAGVTFAIITAFVVVGGWTLGYVRLQRERARVAHTESLVAAAERRRLEDAYQHEQERTQIATEMHDVVAHSWAVVAAQADGARYAVRTDPAAAEDALAVIGETARSAMTDLRAILHRLRYQESLGSTPGWAEAERIVERMRASGMDVQVTEEGIRPSSPLIALNATRIMGEALTNALKHGDLSKPVTVAWDWDSDTELQVSNAVTASTGDDQLDTGHGLIGMTERAVTLGGTLTAVSRDGTWLVALHLPEREETP